MGYLTEDGRHEGYLVPVFVDGARGTGTTGGDIGEDRVVSGPLTRPDGGDWTYPTRPASEVTGWVVCCDCTPADSRRGITWVGPVFDRVASRELEDLTQRRLYAPDTEVAYVADRPEVEHAVIELWRSEHTVSAMALADVEAEAITAAQAKRRLDTSVALARHHGATWAEIGRATGMSGQSAQGRWHDTVGPGQ
jgi:hypothetical protein